MCWCCSLLSDFGDNGHFINASVRPPDALYSFLWYKGINIWVVVVAFNLCNSQLEALIYKGFWYDNEYQVAVFVAKLCSV